MVRIIFLPIIIVLLSHISRIHCVDVIGDRVVLYMETPQNWFTAVEMCNAAGMQLLSILNAEENHKIIEVAEKYKPRPGFWLAASDLGHDRDFVWTTTGSKVEYTDYSPGEPSNTGEDEHCLQITYYSGDPKWNDIHCTFESPFFCEKKVALPTMQPVLSSCVGTSIGPNLSSFQCNMTVAH